MLRKVCFITLFAGAMFGADLPRNDWYRDAIVTLHFDNHGGLLGKGETAESLTEKLRGIPVSLIQVSGRSGRTTYPSRIGVPTAGADQFDTLAIWKQVAKNLGVKYGVYVNVLGDEMARTRPEWLRVDATGKRGERTCLRPGADGHGYLEDGHIPVIQEIIARYAPDSMWFDGDWNMPLVDYCAQCKAAWKAESGEAEPPTSPQDPRWTRWVELETKRLDQYKRRLGDAIHAANPRTIYTGNWSWAISARDVRQPPAYVDALSGDVGAGESRGALYDLRFSTMMLSAQESVPYDLMSAIYPKPIRTMPRCLQEGGLVMGAGANWFLWLNQITDAQLSAARRAATFVQDRKSALGRTHSLNPIALLLSETEWARQRPTAGAFDSRSTRALAFALQDAGAAADVVNEATLLEKLAQYRVVLVVNQKNLSNAAQTALAGFTKRGGKLITLPAAIAEPDAAGVVRGLMEREGVGRLISLTSSGTSAPQVVASLRRNGKAAVLHLTDLTSYKDGQLIEPNSRHDIDENHRIDELKLVVAVPSKPKSLQVSPASTTQSWKWSAGKLYLTLRNFNVHAAVSMVTTVPTAWPLLSASEKK